MYLFPIAYAGFFNEIGGLENELQLYFILSSLNNCRRLGEVFENICSTSTSQLF